MKPFWERGARGWPECSQRCRGCPFLALSGFRMIHSMAKPLKVFPNPDLEICPTQQLTKTQLKDHSINLPSLCSSLFPSRVFASCWFGIKTSQGQKDKGLFTWSSYCVQGWSHTLVCGLPEESNFFRPPLPICTHNELSSRHSYYLAISCARAGSVVIKSVGLGIYY